MAGRCLVALLLITTVAAAPDARPADGNWPEFRGPTQQGHAEGADPPVTWSDNQNIRFKTEIPGRGWSSPVIWGDQIWMTTATLEGKSLRVIGVNKETGAIVHDVEVFHVDEPGRINPANSYASPSPVVEDGRLYVSFGTEGSACIDTATATPIWKMTGPRINHMEGAGSSPSVCGNLFILQCDGIDAQFIAAFNKQTGRAAWKTDRIPFPPNVITPERKAYGTPLIVRVNGQDQLISPAARRVYSYDPRTGTEIWHVDFDPPAYNTAARPVYADGVLFVSTGYDHAQLWAIRLDASCRGDVTASHVLWKCIRGAPLKPSPLVVGHELYLVGDNGIAKCLDAATGDEIWRARVGSAFSASPVDAAGRIYFFGEGGRSVIIRAGRSFKIIGDNYLESGGCMATPAFSGKAIFLRSKTHLYRVQN